MKRIFIAVKVAPYPALLKMLSDLKSGLKDEGIKWVNNESIHITLAFLGDTEEEKIEAVRSGLREEYLGFGKFELILKGAGVFRNISDPRVIWAGIEKSDKLNQLNYSIKKNLLELNIKTEDRPFNPHLTLGRIKKLKQTKSLAELLEKYRDAELQIVPVDEIILYESILSQQGPVYKTIDKFQIHPDKKK